MSLNKRLLRMPLHFLFLESGTVIFPLDLPDEIPFLFSLVGALMQDNPDYE